jgi:GTP-binding protein
MFVDYANVTIRSGHGGRGCVSFRREKFLPKGGPNGGDGGNGGNVVLIGDARLNSLSKYRYSPHLYAKNGHPGAGNNRTGKRGADFTAKVPCGTILRDAETEEIICEIIEPDVPVLVAKGGKGGLGNQHFATPTRQVPRYAQPGLPGVEFRAVLELKVMADVGLVGLPNAGKSSCIQAVSHARPKIGSYPFTTLNPQVGVVELSDFRTMMIADIPGIIKGAAGGKGLGIQFLKHVERTRVLLFILDISPFADQPASEAFEVLRREIEAFGHGLQEKPYLIAANKMDMDQDGTGFDNLLTGLNADDAARVLKISALQRTGLDSLLESLYGLVHRVEQD